MKELLYFRLLVHCIAGFFLFLCPSDIFGLCLVQKKLIFLGSYDMIFSYFKGGSIMNEVYGLIVKREKQENYGFPMPLKEIDELTTAYTEEELLEQVSKSNIIPNIEKANPSLGIAKKRNNKWVEDKQIPMIKDPFLIHYSLEEIFLKNPANQKTYCNVLYSRLSPLLAKQYISEPMKQAILAIRISVEEFLQRYAHLDYIDQRKIKYIFATEFDIRKLLEPEEMIQLQRKKEEKRAA